MQDENAELLRDFAWRLNARTERKGLSQSEIAEKLGVSVTRVNHWFRGRNFPKAAERLRLADLLEVNLEWLLRGEGDIEKTAGGVVEESQAGYAVREIPVISWSHAGAAATYDEMPKHWQGKVATTSRDRKAFAVTIEGDCMEPKFFAGDRVVLEPSGELRNGKPVVAKLADDAVQLRVYTKMPSGAIRLASLKPDIYPTLEYSPTAFHWIYPVRELVRSV
ncbi:MAG: LexA family transcriptional regulator [Candidatus Didemnitutus sp.]|nr:LexA family transcriptional regulator [Candidatus Didemnitutus sp.]